MAKKEANSFVLTIAGIAAATVIGVVGVKLTPAPHVIFSLAPSAEPQATAEPDPISCVLAGTGQVVDFADPGAEEYVSLLDTDSQSLTERYALPALERMTQSDTESLIAPLQVKMCIRDSFSAASCSMTMARFRCSQHWAAR